MEFTNIIAYLKSCFKSWNAWDTFSVSTILATKALHPDVITWQSMCWTTGLYFFPFILKGTVKYMEKFPQVTNTHLEHATLAESILNIACYHQLSTRFSLLDVATKNISEPISLFHYAFSFWMRMNYQIADMRFYGMLVAAFLGFLTSVLLRTMRPRVSTMLDLVNDTLNATLVDLNNSITTSRHDNNLNPSFVHGDNINNSNQDSENNSNQDSENENENDNNNQAALQAALQPITIERLVYSLSEFTENVLENRQNFTLRIGDMTLVSSSNLPTQMTLDELDSKYPVTSAYSRFNNNTDIVGEHGGRYKEVSDLYEKVKEKGNTCCTVCLEECTDHQLNRILGCEHIFHCTCVDQWLLQRKSCPTCRVQI